MLVQLRCIQNGQTARERYVGSSAGSIAGVSKLGSGSQTETLRSVAVTNWIWMYGASTVLRQFS